MSSIAPDWLYWPRFIIVFALVVAAGTSTVLQYLGIDFAPGFEIAALIGLVFVFVVLSHDQYRSYRG